MPPDVTGKSLQDQIDALGERMESNFSELKVLLRNFEERVRLVETREAGCYPVIQQRMDAAWRTIDQHSADIKALNETIISLKQSNRILTWLGGLLGSTLILWLAGQLLGLIQ